MFANRLSVLVIGALLALPLASAQQATVTGLVLNAMTGQPIPGITVSSGELLATTDPGGAFRLPVQPGSLTVQVVGEGFITQAVGPLELAAGGNQDFAVALTPLGAGDQQNFGSELQVVADATGSTAEALLSKRRTAAVVSDSIGKQEISQNGAGDAAKVVERLTGVTVVDDSYVYVRGLGERYSSTSLNGSRLPTTEPEKRVVPLDLFPAKLLDSIAVTKTYTPDRPGDFAGGLVELNTVSFPNAQSFTLSLGAADHDLTTGNAFSSYASGLSLSGGGGQAAPADLPTERLRPRTILNPGGLDSAELESIGESFASRWEPDGGKASPNQSFALSYGNTFGPLGVALAATRSAGFTSVDEATKFYAFGGGEDTLIALSDYDSRTDKENVRLGLIGNVSLKLTDQHVLELSTIFTRNASAESRSLAGFNYGAGTDIEDNRLRYKVEDVTSLKLGGEHFLPNIGGYGSTLTWSAASSSASNDSDLRETLYRALPNGDFVLESSSESGKIEYFNLDDQIDEFRSSWETSFALGQSVFGSLKGGVDLSSRDRRFDARRFRFVLQHQGLDLTRSPQQLFTAENIGPDGFEIREDTGTNDSYTASHDVDAAFLMTDLSRGRWRLIGGSRYEDSIQQVTSFDPFTPDQAPTVATNHDRDLLPALNAVYQLGSRSNLRLAAARTLNRPEFRELSPFQFTEVVGGRSFAGNPNLQQASIDSLDARWELFPGGAQVIAASVFYKQIDRPIERIIQPTSSLRTSYANADKAELLGVELELRHSLEPLASVLRNFSVNCNYSWVDSEVQIGEQALAVQTNSVRALQGQAANSVNLGIDWFRSEWGTSARVLVNTIDERISDVGADGLPDIYEEPFTELGVLISQSLDRFGLAANLKLSADNLLNEDREFTQGGLTQRVYSPGRSIGLSISFDIF